MKRNKKLLLSLGTLSSIAIPVAAIVSCGTSNYGDNWGMGSHRDVQAYLETSDGTSPWYGAKYNELAPVESLGSTVLAESGNAEMVGMFRKEKEGFDSFKKETTIDPITGNPVTKIVPTTSRSTNLKFEMVNKVIFKFDSAADIVFDSDSNGKLENGDPDTKSINGNHFQDVLLAAKFKTIQFKINPEAKKHHWIKQETGEKGSTFKSSDLFYSIMQEITFSSGLSRYNRGGSAEADAFINKKTEAGTALFSTPNATDSPSFYLGQEVTVGMLKDQFSFANKDQVIPDDDTFNLNFNGTGSGAKLKSFWNTNFKEAGGVHAMSTDEIQAAIQKVKFPDSIATPEFLKSDTYLSGGYQIYSQDAPDHYVGGPYYVSVNTKQKLTMHINEDYINQDYINQKNKEGKRTHLNTYSTNFIQKSDLAETIMAQGYKQGFTATASTKGFSKDEILNAMKNPEKYGLSFSSGYTSSAMLGDYTVQQLMPFLSSAVTFDKDGKPVAGNESHNVYYNNGYAKVMWGKTIKEIKEGGDKNGEIAKTLFDGTGLEFRTAIQAAINTYTAVAEYSDSSQDWTSWFAPEGGIMNPTGENYEPAHPDKVDSSEAEIKAALTRITSKFSETVADDGKITSEEHTRVSYEDIYTSPTQKAIEKYAAKQMAGIRASIKDALDKSNLDDGEKVMWEFSYGRGMTSTLFNPVYEKVRQTINGLDNRINLVAKATAGTEDGKVESKVEIEEITPDFIMEQPGNQNNKYWIQRLMAIGQGTNAGSLKVATPYTVASPASPMTENLGYLQTGVLIGLSFYAENEDLCTPENHLEGLKNIISRLTTTLSIDKDIWEKQMDAFIKEQTLSINKKVAELKAEEAKKAKEKNTSATLTEADKAKNKSIDVEIAALEKEAANLTGQITSMETVKKALGKIDLKHIHQSKFIDMINYDYFGWSDLADIKNLKMTDHNTADSSAPLSKIISLANNLINSWFSDTKYTLDTWMTDLTTNPVEIMDTMTAFQIIAPWSLNPLDTMLGNREHPSMAFKKNWFFSGADTGANQSIDYMRVDLDKEGN